jgi:hypothetical protein
MFCGSAFIHFLVHFFTAEKEEQEGTRKNLAID